MDLYSLLAKDTSGVGSPGRPSPLSVDWSPEYGSVESAELVLRDQRSPSLEYRIACSTCRNETSQSQAYVCVTCNVWPYCRRCIAKEHRSPDCDIHLVQPFIESRCSMLLKWFQNTGETYLLDMNTIYKMILRSLFDCESVVLEASPCEVDPILCGIVKSNYLSDLYQRRTEYMDALNYYKEFETEVLKLAATRDLTAVCELVPSQFFHRLARDLDILDTLCRALISKESRMRVDAAIMKVDKLVRLFKTLPSAQKAEENQWENETMKRIRSTSLCKD